MTGTIPEWKIWTDLALAMRVPMFGVRGTNSFIRATRRAAKARRLLGSPHPQAPAGFGYQLVNKRSRHSMNSWLDELPGLHPGGRTNDVRTSRRRPAGCGWGSRVFDPLSSTWVALERVS